MLHDELGKRFDREHERGSTRCPYCGEPKAKSKEHLLPRVMTGFKESEWDIYVCRDCNDKKSYNDQCIVSWHEWNVDNKELHARIEKIAAYENGGFVAAIRRLFGGRFIVSGKNGVVRLLMDPYYMKLWEPWARSVASGLYYLQEEKILDKEQGCVQFIAIDRMEALACAADRLDENLLNLLREAIGALETGRGRVVSTRGNVKVHCVTINRGFIMDWGDWYFFIRLAAIKQPQSMTSYMINVDLGLMDVEEAWQRNKRMYGPGLGVGTLAIGREALQFCAGVIDESRDAAILGTVVYVPDSYVNQP